MKKKGGPRRNRRSLPINIAASYSRYSSDKQFEESLLDQKRKCREKAAENEHHIPSELEFSDSAVAGTKLQREGSDALREAAEEGRFSVLYIYSLSRLSREQAISVPLLKRLVYSLGIRIISVADKLDSNVESFDMLASIVGIVDQQYLANLQANVFRGQEGTVLRGLSVGDYCLGYTSSEVVGAVQEVGKGQHKPQRCYVIDEAEAEWVRQIFHWYVAEGRNIAWITRELNRRGAPKDHRSSEPTWHRDSVDTVLSNSKYTGRWHWGVMENHRDPETGNKWQEPRDEDEFEKWSRFFPELRIIDDATFGKAQEQLVANREKFANWRDENGQFKSRAKGEGWHNARKHLLSQVIACAECGATFHVVGSGGKYLQCPNHFKGLCSANTQLNRERAERLILGALAEQILENPSWRTATLELVRRQWSELASRVPAELSAAKHERDALERKIDRLVDSVEEGTSDPDIRQRLNVRRAELMEIEQRVRELESTAARNLPEPNEAWLLAQLQRLGELLPSNLPAANAALRDLVGGAIPVEVIRVPGRKRHKFRGRMTIELAALATLVCDRSSTADQLRDSASTKRVEIVMDFVDLDPMDELADEAKRLYDLNIPNKEIARRMDCGRSKVTKLLDRWFAKYELVKPDGRSRRAQTVDENRVPPLYQRVSDEVWRLVTADVPLKEIAEQIGIDRNVVTKAIRYWHESRGLEAPSGYALRKERNARKRATRRSGPGKPR